MAALNGGEWELFDLSADATENKDLVHVYPDKAREMNTLWQQWAREMKIKK
jgi:hypothetical protein